VALRTPPEQDMFDALTGAGFSFEEQFEFAGHKIDFGVEIDGLTVLLDVNGDRWHRWQKIIECDRVKLDRVLAAGGFPVGVWRSRMLEHGPSTVLQTVAVSAAQRRIPWWDWAVPISSLQEEARVRALLGSEKHGETD
jgi:hypothetical protein